VAAGGGRVRQSPHRKGRHERVGELALQPSDLLAQRPARGALIAGDAGLERSAGCAQVLHLRGKHRSSHG
jgi:hypothetical protein